MTLLLLTTWRYTDDDDGGWWRHSRRVKRGSGWRRTPGGATGWQRVEDPAPPLLQASVGSAQQAGKHGHSRRQTSNICGATTRVSIVKGFCQEGLMIKHQWGFVEAQMAAFPLLRLLPFLLLVGLLGLLEVEADAVADAVSSQVNFLDLVHNTLSNSNIRNLSLFQHSWQMHWVFEYNQTRISFIPAPQFAEKSFKI